MSRILEALRRAEAEREMDNGGERREQEPALEVILGAAQRKPRAELSFAPLEYHYNREHLRAGSLDPNTHAAAERFRQLRYRLEAWRARQPNGVLLVTSAIPGEGKTLVATNLAESLALASARVLLIDADMRRPGVAESLSLEPLPGLTEVLKGELRWQDACRHLNPLGYDYLPAGTATEKAAELLHANALQQLLGEVSEEFDWVIIDSAPLAPFADSLYLAAASRGVLLVARERFTPTDVLEKVLASLREFPLIGMVLNAVSERERDGYYYYYGKRGEATRLETANRHE